MEALVRQKVTPSKIMQVGMGFWSAKTLLTAVNLELFTHLAKEPLSAKEIKDKLGLHSRSVYDFLDSLVALGFITRKGIKETAVYSNTEAANTYLDKTKSTYMGSILEMANSRLYPFWNHLEDALKTGKQQNEAKNKDKTLFETLYEDKQKLHEFVNAMSSIQMENFITLSREFDFSQYKTCCDIGGAKGDLCIQIALQHKDIQCTTLDLPQVQPIATTNVNSTTVKNRINVVSGNFLTDPFPQADVITMSNILHDWGVNDKLTLVGKAYDALPTGGTLVVIENVIDDERRENVFGLLMSLNMCIETSNGFNFSKADFATWAENCGFRDVYTLPLTGSTSALIAVK